MMGYLYFSGHGNFDENTNLTYWSSTEVTGVTATSVGFWNGPMINSSPKSTSLQVRPVHYF